MLRYVVLLDFCNCCAWSHAPAAEFQQEQTYGDSSVLGLPHHLFHVLNQLVLYPVEYICYSLLLEICNSFQCAKIIIIFMAKNTALSNYKRD